MAFSRALYFVALVPPTAVKEQVKNMKLEIKEKFQVAHALKLPAHITLIPPVWLSEDQETQFITLLRSVSQDYKSFFIALSDFGHFIQRTIKLCTIMLAHHSLMSPPHVRTPPRAGQSPSLAA